MAVRVRASKGVPIVFDLGRLIFIGLINYTHRFEKKKRRNENHFQMMTQWLILSEAYLMQAMTSLCATGDKEGFLVGSAVGDPFGFFVCWSVGLKVRLLVSASVGRALGGRFFCPCFSHLYHCFCPCLYHHLYPFFLVPQPRPAC